jgi:hypothetical protein
MLGQSPPTTSGVVVISGSAFQVHVLDIQFDKVEDQILSPHMDLASSASVDSSISIPVLNFVDTPNTNDTDYLMRLVSSGPTDALINIPVLNIDMSTEDARVQTYLQFVPLGDNLKITSTPATTSGIVVMDFYPGVNVSGGPPPYIPPIYLNQRLYPVTFSGFGERVFPEENRRIYPVLPQFSIITPGD